MLPREVSISDDIVAVVAEQCGRNNEPFSLKQTQAWSISFSPAQFALRQAYWEVFQLYFEEPLNIYDECTTFLAQFGLYIGKRIPYVVFVGMVDCMRRSVNKSLSTSVDETRDTNVEVLESYHATYRQRALAISYSEFCNALHEGDEAKQDEHLARIFDVGTMSIITADMAEDIADGLYMAQVELRSTLVEILEAYIARTHIATVDAYFNSSE